MVYTKYLSIDYGDRRVGIGITDEEKKYSFSRDYIENDGQLYLNLLKLIKEENVEKIVLGYPVNLQSEKTEQTEKVEKFRQKFEQFLKDNSIKVIIEYFDERYTSKLAQQSIFSSGLSKSKRQDKGLVDSVSAQIILQDYLDKSKASGN